MTDEMVQQLSGVAQEVWQQAVQATVLHGILSVVGGAVLLVTTVVVFRRLRQFQDDDSRAFSWIVLSVGAFVSLLVVCFGLLSVLYPSVYAAKMLIGN